MPLSFPPTTVLRCPCKKKSKLRQLGEQLVCLNSNCHHKSKGNGFRLIGACAVLISAETCDTLCDSQHVESPVKRSSSKFLGLRKFMSNGDGLTSKNCEYFISKASMTQKRPKILVIGSGETGRGTDALWNSKDLDVVGTDIYLSASVSTICDAHYLPFPKSYFDGVWIQAVLEHVVDPQAAVREIFRVLKKNGVVYSEIPFMQQVHEGAFDFTRFTLSGHRYLFRRFDAIRLGVLGGPGVAFSWSFRYYIWSLTRSKNIARLGNLVMSIICRLLGPFESRKSKYDSYSGSFFLGQKSTRTIEQRELLDIYEGNIK